METIATAALLSSVFQRHDGVAAFEACALFNFVQLGLELFHVFHKIQ